ncbi:MAG TPA: ricin-type beta-trefoil lectin domain protein, partial [Actinoplanes sp.]|nr:ricin-type beta-trefoil lectin domain protein [Actinoplanes sp.]
RAAALIGTPVLVSALAVLTVAFNIGSVASAAEDCPVPEPMKEPATSAVVGSGNATDCTEAALRTALLAGGRITFDCGADAVTIPVTQELTVPKDVLLDGGGKVTLAGGGSNRLLVPRSGTHLSVQNLGLLGGAAKKLTATDQGDQLNGGAIAGGWRTHVEVVNSTLEKNTADGLGGAIYVGTDSTLSIVDSVLTGNSSASGGAVRGLLSPITIVNSTLNANTSTGGGGALETDGVSAPERRDGRLLICGSTISHNSSRDDGGGAFIWTYFPEKIVIRKTTFEGNTTATGSGGAARLSTGPSEKGDGRPAPSPSSADAPSPSPTTPPDPSLTIERSSFLSNSAGGNGGGLYLHCAPTCDIRDSTVHGNKTQSFGGAVFGENHRSYNVTYADNSADNMGGAFYGGGFEAYNTVFAGNTAKNSWGFAQNCHSTGTGDNVLQWPTPRPGGDSPCIAGTISADPRLAAPADNGGSTLTMLPAADSPLLGAGQGCGPTDQRGTARGTGACDLGAVQLSTSAPSTPATESGPSGPTAPDVSSAPPSPTATPTAVPTVASALPPAPPAPPTAAPPAPPTAASADSPSATVDVAGTTDNAAVVIIGGQSGRCLDVPPATAIDGTQLQLADCSGQADQSWTRTAAGQLIGYGDKCLSTQHQGTGNGTPVVVEACTGQAGEQWRVNADGTITEAASGRCLDAFGGHTATGTKIIIWNCHGRSNQRWLLRP